MQNVILYMSITFCYNDKYKATYLLWYYTNNKFIIVYSTNKQLHFIKHVLIFILYNNNLILIAISHQNNNNIILFLFRIHQLYRM